MYSLSVHSAITGVSDFSMQDGCLGTEQQISHKLGAKVAEIMEGGVSDVYM